MKQTVTAAAVSAVLLVLSACVPEVVQRSPAELRAVLEPGLRIQTPDGAGPFPAVVLMHGAGTPVWRKGYGEWMGWLTRRGYAAVFVDSLNGRGIHGDSLMGPTLMPPERAADLYIVLEILRSTRAVDSSRIAVIGMSHGGDTALDALVLASPGKSLPALTETPERRLAGLRGVVAFYPGCREPVAGVHVTENYLQPWTVPVPVLMFQGGNDSFVDQGLCDEVVARQKALGSPIDFVFYPDAPHCFDAEYGDDPDCRVVPEFAADARDRVASFLTTHLGK